MSYDVSRMQITLILGVLLSVTTNVRKRNDTLSGTPLDRPILWQGEVKF